MIKKKKPTICPPQSYLHAVDDNRLIVSTRLTVRSYWKCDSAGTDNNFKKNRRFVFILYNIMCGWNKKKRSCTRH